MKDRRIIEQTAITLLLMLFIISPAYGVKKQMVQAEGNNVGLVLDVTNQPMNGVTHSSYKSSQMMHSFPRGSGNYFGYLIHSFSPCVTRDTDGDGTAEDTARIQMRGQGTWGANCSIESYDYLESLYNQGLVMGNYATDINANRIYTSNDPEDLEDWPVEFREGRSAGGDPVVYGAETIVGRYGDCWRTSGTDMPIGFSMEYSWYFLNYGEANNMVFVHVFFQNTSEYLKWSDMNAVQDHVSQTPDGQVWHDVGLVLAKHSPFFYNGNWAQDRLNVYYLYNPAGEMTGMMDPDGIVEAFSPSTAPVMIEKMLRPPSLNGETMTHRMSHWCKGEDFGVPLSNDFLENAKPHGVMFRALLGDESLYPGVENIWTGRQTAGGWPGMLQPGDEFYDKWLWGMGVAMQYAGWGMLHDMAPRDTTSFDWVFMCVPMEQPYDSPPREIQYIRDQGLQDHLDPVRDYADIAQAVYDGNYILPETPVAPALTIVPGDKQVTITWSDINTKTADPYYYFLEENGLNDLGHYREYDFEGYRLYRSFVGPNDSHAEQIFECSLSDGNIQFFYTDRLEDDLNYERMMNGLKVWYALVPYDRNYDPLSGEEFSLPAPGSGKTWNRNATSPGLYKVAPRSNASNFRQAQLGSWEFISGYPAEPLSLETVELSGDGSGRLTEAPKYLIPGFEVDFESVLDERITQDTDLYLECYGMKTVQQSNGCSNFSLGARLVRLVNSSGEVLDDIAAPIIPRDPGYPEPTITYHGRTDDDGTDFGLLVTYKYLNHGDNYVDLDTGGYAGSQVQVYSNRCWGDTDGSSPGNKGYWRSARYQVSWVDAGNGELTLEVENLVHGVEIPFSPYMGASVWGFMDPDEEMELYTEDFNNVPDSERQYEMSQTVSAAASEEIHVYIGGVPIKMVPPGEGAMVMPSAGSTWMLTTTFGSWNGDQTVFTQYPDPMWPGDKFKVEVKKYTMDKEDIELSKIRVVPNPYLASSFLDLSPSSRRIEFVNLPDRCTIRIYTVGGNLVNVLNHIGANRSGWGDYADWNNLVDNQPMQLSGYDNHGGTEPWNLRNRFGTTVASGLYIYHVTDERGEEHTGKFYIVN